VAYAAALAAMEARNAAVHAGEAAELVWLLEHPPVYTAGTSADPAELLSQQFPVFDTGRGGRGYRACAGQAWYDPAVRSEGPWIRGRGWSSSGSSRGFG
jgi:lipoate-protein ligase B